MGWSELGAAVGRGGFAGVGPLEGVSHGGVEVFEKRAQFFFQVRDG